MAYAFVKIKKQGDVITGFFVDASTGKAVPVNGTIIQATNANLLATGGFQIIKGPTARPYIEAQGITIKTRKTRKVPTEQPEKIMKEKSTTKPPQLAKPPIRHVKKEDQGIKAKELKRIAKIEKYLKIIAGNEQRLLEGAPNQDSILRANAYIKKRIAWYSQPGVDPDQEPPKTFMQKR